jgi:hypothetical protein
VESIGYVPENDFLPRILAPYGVNAQHVSERQAFINEHIAQLEASEGFGLGHKVPLSIIAMGQKMLGIDLAVATPFLASNPAAFTAAALGAVYWGYRALSDDEKAQLHSLIGEAFSFGVELVKTIAEFCIKTMKSLLDAEAFAQLKEYVAEAANAVGSSLYEVTGRLYDRVSEAANSAKSAVSNAGTAVGVATAKTLQSGKALISRNKEEDLK